MATMNILFEVRSSDPLVHKSVAKVIATALPVQHLVPWNVDDYETRRVTVVDTLIEAELVRAMTTEQWQRDVCIKAANGLAEALRALTTDGVGVSAETQFTRYTIGTYQGPLSLAKPATGDDQ